MRASIADCALCHTLEPPQLGSKGIGSGNRGFYVPVPRCIGIGAHYAPPSAIGGKPARSSNLPTQSACASLMGVESTASWPRNCHALRLRRRSDKRRDGKECRGKCYSWGV